MTAAERDAIYRELYWDKIGAERMPAGVDLVMLDPAINSGSAKAHRWYLEAVAVDPDPLGIIHNISSERLGFLTGSATGAATARVGAGASPSARRSPPACTSARV